MCLRDILSHFFRNYILLEYTESLDALFSCALLSKMVDVGLAFELLLSNPVKYFFEQNLRLTFFSFSEV